MPLFFITEFLSSFIVDVVSVCALFENNDFSVFSLSFLESIIIGSKVFVVEFRMGSELDPAPGPIFVPDPTVDPGVGSKRGTRVGTKKWGTVGGLGDVRVEGKVRLGDVEREGDSFGGE